MEKMVFRQPIMGKLAQQFESVYNKLQEFVPENRVANLIMAA